MIPARLWKKSWAATASWTRAESRSSTSAGKVALNGAVPSYPQYLRAAEAARRVVGVTGVRNQLQVVLPPEDYRDDAMLTTAANNALAASAAVPEGVEAMAKDGNLTLTGSGK